MARAIPDLVGMVFGRLTVEGEGPLQGKARRWRCVCECGNKRLVQTSSLRSGGAQSCGCLRSELTKARRAAAPRKVHDVTGLRSGLLVPLRRVSPTHWLCKCDCGNEKEIRELSIRFCQVLSCGCIKAEVARTNGRKVQTHGHAVTDYSMRSAEYKTWCSMKSRCYNPNFPNYSDYGGRGITVCARWRKSFEAFFKDMGPRPLGGVRYTIERKDNSKGYTPANCVWATYHTQARNRRSNHKLTYNGKTQTITEWALEVGMSKVTLCWRINQGWPLDRALTPLT